MYVYFNGDIIVIIFINVIISINDEKCKDQKGCFHLKLIHSNIFFMNFGSPTVLKLPLFPLPFLASPSSQAVSCLSQVSPSSTSNQLIFHLSSRDHSAPPTPLIFFSTSVETSHFSIISSLLILHLAVQRPPPSFRFSPY